MHSKPKLSISGSSAGAGAGAGATSSVTTTLQPTSSSKRSIATKRIRVASSVSYPVTSALIVSDPIIGGGAGAGIASIAVVVPVIPVAIAVVPYALPPFRWNEADIDTEIE